MSGRNGNGHRPGVSLAKLVVNDKTIDVPFGDEAVTVTYRPQWITAITESLLREITDADTPFHKAEPIAALVPKMIADWNLTDESGVTIPLTPEGLQAVPTEILVQIIKAAQDDIRPNVLSATASSDG
jgi:hypothetical protein